MDIHGDRLILSKITTYDLDLICKIECDKDLWYFEESVQSDEEDVRKKYIDKINNKERVSSYDFVINMLVEGDKTPIGLAQIWSYVEYRKSWEISYTVFPEFRGKGYGSEAAMLLLKFAFNELDAHKVVGMCNSKNKSSAALMERIGMTKEAIFKEELLWQNTWTDQFYYSILEKEFSLN